MTRWMMVLAAGLALATVGTGLGSSWAEEGEAGRVLGHVEFREHRVTIEGGSAGIRYTVRTDGGALIATRLDQAELRAQFPDLHDRVQRGLAQAGSAGVQDARLVVVAE